MTLLSTLLPALTAAATGWLIAGANDVVAGGSVGAVRWPLIAVTVLLLIDFGIGGLVWPWRQWLARRVDAAIRHRIRVAMGRPPGVAHLEDQLARDVAEMPLDGVDRSVGLGAVSQLGVVAEFAGAAGSVALVAAWSPLLALFSFAFVLVNRTVMRRAFSGLVTEGFAAILPRIRESMYWKDVAGTPVGAKEVRLFGFAGEATERFRKGNLAYVELIASANRRTMPLFPIFGALAATAVGVPTLFALQAVLNGDLSTARLAVVLGATLGIQRISFGRSMYAIEVAAAQLGALDRLEAAAAGGPLATPAASGSTETPTIRFEGVRFRYPGMERDVLCGLDLTIAAGESLAIVGENGVGKSTLVKLLAGFYAPTAGRITADGVDISGLDPVQWRRRLAVIFQAFTRFQISAGDNVALAGLDHPGREAHLSAAATGAGAAEIVDGLPAGWDTVLSREYAGGHELSGGQWQRIALARALYAASVGGKILILDEPTAHLDVSAEVGLFDQLLTHAEGLTSIVISHRYSTVRRAERIVVIAQGAIIEDGSHDELMARGGEYARLYNLQAEAFTPAVAGEAVDGAL